MYAVVDGGDDVVRVRLKHGGSDLDGSDVSGWAACHRACIGGYPGVLRQLLQAGADPTLREAHRRTASNLAAQSVRPECITTLQEWSRAYTLQRSRHLCGTSPTASLSAV